MGFNTTNDRVFIVETLPPFDKVSFQFMPEGISKTRSAKIKKINIVGRNNDKHQYTGGEDKLSFTIDFLSDEENREDVYRKVNFLESLTMNDGSFGPAKNVKLVMGKFFRKEVWLISSVKTAYSNNDDRYDYLPIRATVKIELILDPEKNRRVRDVRR